MILQIITAFITNLYCISLCLQNDSSVLIHSDLRKSVVGTHLHYSNDFWSPFSQHFVRQHLLPVCCCFLWVNFCLQQLNSKIHEDKPPCVTPVLPAVH